MAVLMPSDFNPCLYLVFDHLDEIFSFYLSNHFFVLECCQHTHQGGDWDNQVDMNLDFIVMSVWQMLKWFCRYFGIHEALVSFAWLFGCLVGFIKGEIEKWLWCNLEFLFGACMILSHIKLPCVCFYLVFIHLNELCFAFKLSFVIALIKREIERPSWKVP